MMYKNAKNLIDFTPEPLAEKNKITELTVLISIFFHICL